MKYIRILIVSGCLSLSACGSDDSSSDVPQPVNEPKAVDIVTRAENVPQGNQVKAGLYMVNYVDGRQGTLLPEQNYVNNQLLTWTSSGWTTSTPIYWNDDMTRADFYGYAPYQPDVTDSRLLNFSIQTDQTTTDGFANSDFLWGKVEGQLPTNGSFNLNLSHLLSMMTVTVTRESGFDDGDFQASDVRVTFGGSKTSCSIDLATGNVTATGSANDVKFLSVGDLTYKAVLIPQQVPFSNLITVDWRGNIYTLQNSYRLEPGRQYNININLKKTKSGFDIGIVGWDIIGENFGGTIGGD